MPEVLHALLHCLLLAQRSVIGGLWPILPTSFSTKDFCRLKQGECGSSKDIPALMIIMCLQVRSEDVRILFARVQLQPSLSPELMAGCHGLPWSLPLERTSLHEPAGAEHPTHHRQKGKKGPQSLQKIPAQ